MSNFFEGLGQSFLAPIDGFVQGLTGIDIVGDDFYTNKTAQKINSGFAKAAPMAVGLAAGAVTGDPTVGMKAYQGSQALAGAIGEQPDFESHKVPRFQDGGMPMPSMLVNIEKGELVVDKATGNIVEDLESHRYKPHNKNKKKEHDGNFIELPEGSFVIPKKDADRYRKNPHLREGIIRNISNLQKERMMYGKDSNGNIQEYNSLVPQAYGGIDPSLMMGNTHPLDMLLKRSGSYMGSNMNTNTGIPDPNSLNGPMMPFDMSNNPSSNMATYNPTTSTMHPLDMQQQSLQKQMPMSPNGEPYPIDGGTLPQVSTSGFNKTNTPDPSGHTMTPGDYMGFAGAAIGGLGPLATTLAVGMDKDESNTMAGVGRSAMSKYASTLGRSREESMRTLRGLDRSNRANIRNASSNFSTMSSRNQASSNQLQQNVGRTNLQYDLPLAQGISSMMFQSDMHERQGELMKQDRLDRNRDNYYSNLSSNLSNLGTMTSSSGQQLNKHKQNQELNKLLEGYSSDFQKNPDGSITFRPK